MAQVSVIVDSTAFDESARDLLLLAGACDLPPYFLDEIAGLLDQPTDMMHVLQTSRRTAPTTIETIVTVYPSDRLNDLMAAIRARDWDLKSVEYAGHESFPQPRAKSFAKTSR